MWLREEIRLLCLIMAWSCSCWLISRMSSLVWIQNTLIPKCYTALVAAWRQGEHRDRVLTLKLYAHVLSKREKGDFPLLLNAFLLPINKSHWSLLVWILAVTCNLSSLSFLQESVRSDSSKLHSPWFDYKAELCSHWFSCGFIRA